MPKNRIPALRIALLCAALGLLSLLPCLAVHQGRLLYYGDYFRQYVPFLLETKRMLRSGSLAWSWNTFLGDSFYGAYSYYTAVNPFARLAMLFPDSLILYGTLLAQLAKFACAGVCASLYLRRFAENPTVIAAGAVLYTFSGFTIINNNYYFFLDVIAVFPLLLYGIERAAEQKDRRSMAVLALAVFVNAEINYYFFVSSCLLCLIYCVFRFELYRLPAGGLRLLARLAVSAAAGTGLAGFALLPSFWKILHTPKAASSIGGLYLHPYSIENMLERVRIFFMPIENNIEHAFYRCGSWTSTAVYLPVFGALFALLFLFRNRRHWLARMTACLFIFLMIPVLNSVFTLFSDFSYTRWLYAFVLLLDLASVLLLEKREAYRGALKRWYGITMTVTAVLCVPPALVCLLAYFGVSTPLSALYSVAQSTIYAGMKGVVIALALTAVNDLLLAVIVFRPSSYRRVLALVCAASVINYAGYLAFYNYINADRLDSMLEELSLEDAVDESPVTYRTDSSSGNQNRSLFLGVPSVSGYHSLQNENAESFAIAAGYADTASAIVLDRPEQDSGALDTLLSVRYYTDLGNDPEAAVPEGFSLVSDENGVKTYENDNYLPFGFCYDSYLTEAQAEESGLSRTQLMLSALVADDSTAEALSGLLPQYTDTGDFDLSAAADARRAQCTDSFAGTSSGFTASITLDSANYVFFSVPNDAGWSASVNGEPADILTVNYGLCAIRCDAGTSEICFTYHTPLLRAGCAVSAASAVLLLLLLLPFPARRKDGSPE